MLGWRLWNWKLQVVTIATKDRFPVAAFVSVRLPEHTHGNECADIDRHTAGNREALDGQHAPEFWFDPHGVRRRNLDHRLSASIALQKVCGSAATEMLHALEAGIRRVCQGSSARYGCRTRPAFTLCFKLRPGVLEARFHPIARHGP